ncbi:MAG: L,D-transpeptidase, partial [Mobilitalea sp.]
MKITTRRLFSRQRIFLFLCFAVLSFLACTQQVSAEENQKKTYLIKVNRSHNTVTVYEQDKNGVYNVPIKAMLCSVGLSGTPTKVGTFRTMAKYRWKLLMGDVWGQYSTRIVGGILFHSVYYYSMNPQTLATNQFNKLGRAASHGCIRLSVADAKWIYDNCDVGTTVTIYDDPKSPGPLGKPEAIKISGNLRWDPTDPNPENPYNKLQPVITGAKNLNTEYGISIDYLNGIK